MENIMKKHIIELLDQANKQISDIINKMENSDMQDKTIVNQVNDVIRQLDIVVEHLENNS